jgi:pyruvate dehydrogenase E1 component alpha subunit
VQDFSIMGASYGIPGKQVNGMDIIEVYEEVSQTVQQARTEKLASFLEIRTYRYRGHSMSDPAKYRTKEELAEYKQQDPILLLKANLLEKNLLTEEEFKDIDQKCKAISDESVRFSEESEEPALETLYEDVLV